MSKKSNYTNISHPFEMGAMAIIGIIILPLGIIWFIKEMLWDIENSKGEDGKVNPQTKRGYMFLAWIFGFDIIMLIILAILYSCTGGVSSGGFYH